MLRQIDGSFAVAEAVALCRPHIVSCYPITPQTHIVEHLGELVKDGHLKNCEFVNTESEFGAMSLCIGSSSAGARTYTATASQGLLFMMEAVYNASGMGLPIVMTLGNRAIGAPINIWNDHTDAMSARDAGWIQLFVESNQEAVDVHIQAFKLAETLSLPVMVCMDGFILTHSYTRIDMPTQEQVDQFLPPFHARQKLDPADPVSMGAMVGPEAFTEVRYLAHYKQLEALELIPKLATEFDDIVGRDSGGLLKSHYPGDAETVVITMGSVIGTMKEVLTVMRDEGTSIGAVTVRSFRPFPKDELCNMLQNAKRVIVFEKALAVGLGGILSSNVRWALRGIPIPVYSVIGGLGGRPIVRPSLRKLFDAGVKDQLEETHYLDLNLDVVKRQIDRERAQTGSGPAAENILRDIGTVRAAKTA
ncbi:MAG: transketolase C-terminal domain-containing protein [Candidatus Competibacteraceae bacterium]|jgi:pyruvate ferredoxin oxidoreductase alpha subunit|nr:transketolase C-terminal domain-containing protein [Candidatus Competibacteraceae bacterium]